MTAPEDIRDLPLEALIDRLVDGDVAPRELRRALGRLDAAPDGWRRCTLAFLEAQSLSEALRCHDEPVLRGDTLRLASATAPEVSPRMRPRRDRFPARQALAAAVALAAFTLGWVGHGWRGGGPSPRPTESAPRESATPASSGERAATELARSEAVPRAVTPSATLRVPAIREVARIPIGDGATPEAEVPILAGSGLDERWLNDQPPPVSEYQQARWERQGYQLEQQRRLVSVPLADGRRAAIPVDQVRVRFVGHDPL